MNSSRPSFFEPVYYCQQERTTELSNRIYDRNLPTRKIPATFDPRPEETRHCRFPIQTIRREKDSFNESASNFRLEQDFTPGKSTFDEFQRHVDDERHLTNSVMARHKGCPDTEWVPNSTSTLYNRPRQLQSSVSWSLQHEPAEKAHPYLDKRYLTTNMRSSTSDACGLETPSLFFNSSREAVRRR
jgi:hypothetical protein